MSAFGTKKKGGDLALQMTFPDVTASIIADEAQPYGYVGRAMIGKADLPAADDLQQLYHTEKKRWADTKAMEWVHNNARTRWLMNHNTYGYTQPYASLGQRIFANPSLGNFSDIYAARDDIADHMVRDAKHKEFERKFFDLLEDAHLEGGLHGAGMWDWWYKLEDWFADTAFGKWLGDNGWKLLATAGAQGHLPSGDQLVEKAAARQRRVREEKEKLEREERERAELERVNRRKEAEDYRRNQYDDESGPSGSPTPQRSAAERRAAAAAAAEKQRKAKADYEAARDKKQGKETVRPPPAAVPAPAAQPSTTPHSTTERRAAAAAAAEKQRKAKADYEAARDKKIGKGDLHGGVLRTAEGQRYGRQLLRDRITQLNAIEAGRPGVTENPFGPVVFPREPNMPEETLSKDDEKMIRLRSLLEIIAGTYQENADLHDLNVRVLSRVVGTITEAKTLLIQLAPDFSNGDFNDVLNLLLEAEYLAREDYVQRALGNDGELTETIAGLYNNVYAMLKYTEGMFSFINNPRNEKVAKSRNLVKTLGLTGTVPDYFETALGEYGDNRGKVNTANHRIAVNPDNFIGGRKKRILGRIRRIYGGADPCDYPEWEYRPISNFYKPGDKVMYKGKAYECVSKTTNMPLRQPPDPNAGEVQAQWKEIACGQNGIEATLNPEAIAKLKTGFDFSNNEAQPFNPPPPAVPQQPYVLMPEQPDAKLEKQRQRTPNPPLDKKAFPAIVKFDVDQRITFGDSQGAYYGEKIGERVPIVPVPIPVEPDGSLVHPGSGYTRPTFPKFAVQKKPSNSLKPRKQAPLPMFQDSASGIFSAARMPNAPVTSVPTRQPFSFVGGAGLTRKTLPKTVDGFMELAKSLEGSGTKIAVRPTSKLSSIRATFIRKLKL